MEEIINFIRKIPESIKPKLEETRIIYDLPFPKSTIVRGIEEEGPAHKGNFRGAIDFLVDNGTPVLAPFSGEIVNVIDCNDRYGSGSEFADYLNYITIRHNNGEYSQLAHLAKGSAKGQAGDSVCLGDTLAITGNSGWMTEPHLHFFVFKLGRRHDFKGLKPRFREEVAVSK